MKRFLMAVLLSLAGSALAIPPVLATEFPSAVTGDYVGGGYMCRLVFGIQPSQQRGLEVRCTEPDGEQTAALVTTNICPSDALNFYVPLTRWGSQGAFAPGTDWIRPIAYDADSITLRIGSYGTIVTGGGQFLTLIKARSFAPPVPYAGCGGTIGYSKPRD